MYDIVLSNCTFADLKTREKKSEFRCEDQTVTQGNCATEGNSGNCQSGNCHSGERWMRKPSVHGGK